MAHEYEFNDDDDGCSCGIVGCLVALVAMLLFVGLIVKVAGWLVDAIF